MCYCQEAKALNLLEGENKLAGLPESCFLSEWRLSATVSLKCTAVKYIFCILLAMLFWSRQADEFATQLSPSPLHHHQAYMNYLKHHWDRFTVSWGKLPLCKATRSLKLPNPWSHRNASIAKLRGFLSILSFWHLDFLFFTKSPFSRKLVRENVLCKPVLSDHTANRRQEERSLDHWSF